MEQKYPSASPPAASSRSSSAAAITHTSNGTNVLCSVLVELFEMIPGSGNPAPKAYGPKGLTLQRVASGNGDATFQLLVFAPVTKKVEFSVSMTSSFSLTVLPDRFASFEDPASGRSWCLKFGSADDAVNTARCVALVEEVRDEESGTEGEGETSSARGIIRQELTVGSADGAAVAIGDQIKCRYTVYAYDPSTPFFIGRALFTLRESAKYIVGTGSLLDVAVEESLCGMRRKGTRLLIVPPHIANGINENAEWGPHVKDDTTLIVEVTVSSVRSSLPVESHVPASAAAEEEETTGTNDEETQPPQQAQSSAQPSYSAPAGDAEPGVNPTAIPAQADLRSRMAVLANAQHAVTIGAATAPAQTSVASRRESFGGAAAPYVSSGVAAASPAAATPDALESLLAELHLVDLLPNFRREGVTLHDLELLDADEWKQLVPQMGPRRRISGRIAEIKQQRDNAPSTNNTTLATPATTSVAATPVVHETTHQKIAHASPQRARFGDAPVAHTAAAAPVAAASSYRPRTASDVQNDAPTSAPASSSSSSRLTQLGSQAALESLLAAEYERGKSEAVALARAKISDIKDAASARFTELQQEVTHANARNEADREKARELVQRLREELRTVTDQRDANAHALDTVSHEKDALSEKTQKYVSQLRARHEAEKESARSARDDDHSRAAVLAAMETLFEAISTRVKPKDLYEGDEVLALVKAAVKSVVKQGK